MASFLIFLQINVFTSYVLLPIKCVYYSETCVLSHIRLFEILWTVACQALLSMGFSRQEYWSQLPVPSPGDLSNPGIEPRSPALQAESLPSEPLWKPLVFTGFQKFQASCPDLVTSRGKRGTVSSLFLETFS